MAKQTGAGPYMISVVAQRYKIHPQTLRLYEREGLLKPSRTDGNTRLYGEEDIERLETILSLTRDLGVNLAGVEIILNMREKMARMQHEVNEFMHYVKQELRPRRGRLGTAPRDRARQVARGRSRAAGVGRAAGDVAAQRRQRARRRSAARRTRDPSRLPAGGGETPRGAGSDGALATGC